MAFGYEALYILKTIGESLKRLADRRTVYVEFADRARAELVQGETLVADSRKDAWRRYAAAALAGAMANEEIISPSFPTRRVSENAALLADALLSIEDDAERLGVPASEVVAQRNGSLDPEATKPQRLGPDGYLLLRKARAVLRHFQANGLLNPDFRMPLLEADVRDLRKVVEQIDGSNVEMAEAA